ncbi:MAG: hypothetical protein GDA51_10905 [Ekhidna sp.]|nr:hypothetical protein [Ekhidna sp.]MBC6409653.1 hypothetical protein [Ekhidna sp.]MBC6426949.1 hypothetical protein [Ekhidna sp.]
MKELIPIVGIIAVFGSIILFVSILTNYSLKRKLIDKNMVNEKTANLFKREDGKLNALKWGLITLLGGVGLITIDSMRLDADDAMAWGIEAVCVAVGFLTYYFLTRKNQ